MKATLQIGSTISVDLAIRKVGLFTAVVARLLLVRPPETPTAGPLLVGLSLGSLAGLLPSPNSSRGHPLKVSSFPIIAVPADMDSLFRQEKSRYKLVYSVYLLRKLPQELFQQHSIHRKFEKEQFGIYQRSPTPAFAGNGSFTPPTPMAIILQHLRISVDGTRDFERPNKLTNYLYPAEKRQISLQSNIGPELFGCTCTNRDGVMSCKRRTPSPLNLVQPMLDDLAAANATGSQADLIKSCTRTVENKKVNHALNDRMASTIFALLIISIMMGTAGLVVSVLTGSPFNLATFFPLLLDTLAVGASVGLFLGIIQTELGSYFPRARELRVPDSAVMDIGFYLLLGLFGTRVISHPAFFMMTEEDELLARISQLAGQINQHKNQSVYPVRGRYSGIPHSSSGPHRRGNTGWRPYRGRGRGGARPPLVGPHRHRTLVLNGQNTSSDHAGTTVSAHTSPDEVANSNTGAKGGWVAKRDRHMQLINSSIFNQETQARNKAIEETRRLKMQKKAQKEEMMVLRHAHQAPGQPSDQRAFTILVENIPFQVTQGGSKLVKLSSEDFFGKSFIFEPAYTFIGNPSTANATPKKVKVGGTCFKGPACPYIHNPDKVAICKQYLQTGNCDARDACDLSHEPSPERSPACLHFLRGRCTNDSCRYAHVRVTPGAPVCRDFALLGYCIKGNTCEERHVHECPNYANTGNCGNKKCPLPHVDRAGQIRKLNANKVENSGDGELEDDISSEEEAYDEIDSDDIDSDDLDEMEEIIPNVPNTDISEQADFIRL
ncbi:hypothetical protein FQN57_005983 [Myotisia sp. PD_48]|nr:hypothetical protein FQN57_005983 [Myotisia sp. PD_48]